MARRHNRYEDFKKTTPRMPVDHCFQACRDHKAAFHEDASPTTPRARHQRQITMRAPVAS